MEKIIIHTRDQQQIETDKNILIKYSYFKDIIENCVNVTELTLPFDHSSVIKFLTEWNHIYDDNDLELADFLGQTDYIILILTQMISGKINDNNLKLINRYHCHVHFIDLLVSYIEQNYNLNIIYRYGKLLMGYESFNLKKLIDCMLLENLVIFIEKFPLNNNRTQIYFDIIDIAHSKLGDKLVDIICPQIDKYDKSILFNILHRESLSSELKKFYNLLYEKIFFGSDGRLEMDGRPRAIGIKGPEGMKGVKGLTGPKGLTGRDLM